MISVLLYGRNDDRGYGMTKRVAIGVNALALQVDGGAGEILFVDYNTPDHLPTLPELIWDSLTTTARRRLRILRVRPAHHARFETALPVLEPVARNVALRRSNGANRWILSTNTDAMVARLGEQRLVDMAETLPDGVYGLPRFELPERCWEGFDRRDPEGCLALAAAWSDECHLREEVAGVPDVLFDNPGDFQLMPRADLMTIGGFEEEMLDGWHVDHNIACRMGFRLGPPRSLADRFALYHLGHARSLSATHGPDRRENDTGRFVRDLTGPQALHQPGRWGLAEEEIEEIRLDTAPGESVRAACRAAMDPLAGRTPTARYTPESFDRFACDVGAVVAHILDLVSPLPRDAILVFAGVRRDMFAALMRGLAALGFRNRLLVPETLAERLDAERLPAAQVGPDCAVLERADALIFAFGLIGDETEAVRSDAGETPAETAALQAVSSLLQEAARVERRRQIQGGAPRLFLVANAVHSRFEREVGGLIAASASPFATRLRHGFLRGGEAAPRPVHAEARRWLPLLTRGQPLSRRETLEIATRGDAISSLIDEAAAQGGGEEEIAAMRQAFESCRKPHPAMRVPLSAVAAPALSSAARADSWDDPSWRSEAQRIESGAARTGWIWERAQLLHGLGHLLPSGEGHVLAVCEHPEPMLDMLRARYGQDVVVLDVRSLFREGPVLDGAGHLEEIPTASCRAILAPHASLFRHGLLRSAEAMAPLRPLLKPGGIFALAAEIALNGGERAMRACLPAADSEGLPAVFAEHLGLLAIGPCSMAPRPEDAALVATPEEAREKMPALGLATGRDVLWPATWFFEARDGLPSQPDMAAFGAALSDLQLGDLRNSLSLGTGALRDETGRILAAEEGGKAGHMAYGPYLRLDSGDYRATLAVQHARRAGVRSSRMVAEVALGGEAVVQRKLRPGRSMKHDAVTLDFRVPPDAAPLEIRLWTDGNCTVVLDAVSLSRKGGAAPVAGSARRLASIGP